MFETGISTQSGIDDPSYEFNTTRNESKTKV